MKKTTKTDEAIRIAKPTRSYKKHYLVTLNPFYLLDCYGSLMERAKFMICPNGMISRQSYQMEECKPGKKPIPVPKCH